MKLNPCLLNELNPLLVAEAGQFMHWGSTLPSRIGNEQQRNIENNVQKAHTLVLMLNNKVNFILSLLGNLRVSPNVWK